MLKVMSIFGTRPDAIKMCPLVKELEKTKGIESVVCLTGQHREMLLQVIDVFRINVKYNLDIMRAGQTLVTITTDILQKMTTVLELEQPDLVLVHGDTSTTFAAALAAFYQQIPVGHVEAGLRTYDKYSPFPEEMNRSLVGRIAELHFAPTKKNKENLEAEGIKDNIFVTGNTVIDAFKTTVNTDYSFKNEELRKLFTLGKRLLLVTAHRRENIGEPLRNICNAIRQIADIFDDVEIIYPVHMNPSVREVAHEVLDACDRVHLISPLDVTDMHNLIARSYMVLTDSGGLQEEAPAFGIPILVLRTETERPEAVEAGTVRVVGVDQASIYESAKELLLNKEKYNEMAKAVNPYGDGHAGERIIRHILEWARDKNGQKVDCENSKDDSSVRFCPEDVWGSTKLVL